MRIWHFNVDRSKMTCIPDIQHQKPWFPMGWSHTFKGQKSSQFGGPQHEEIQYSWDLFGGKKSTGQVWSQLFCADWGYPPVYMIYENDVYTSPWWWTIVDRRRASKHIPLSLFSPIFAGDVYSLLICLVVTMNLLWIYYESYIYIFTLYHQTL